VLGYAYEMQSGQPDVERDSLPEYPKNFIGVGCRPEGDSCLSTQALGGSGRRATSRAHDLCEYNTAIGWKVASEINIQRTLNGIAVPDAG
jgi:hypothetical protein